jgi:hypothetical protein
MKSLLFLKKIKKLPYKGLIAASMTLITSGLAVDAIKGERMFTYITPLKDIDRLYVGIVVVAAFISSLIWLYSRRRDFITVRGLITTEATPHKVLVVLLSLCNYEIVEEIDPEKDSPQLRIYGDSLVIKKRNMPDATTIEFSKHSLRDLIAALDGYNLNWQQLLRGISIHLNDDTLKCVYIIGSSGKKTSKGSYNQIDYAKELIGYFLKDKDNIVAYQKPVDFEDLNELNRTINSVAKELLARGYSEEDIIIDVTGGQKTTSIAGAMITLSSNITFQYVQTGDDNKVLQYDVYFHNPFDF